MKKMILLIAAVATMSIVPSCAMVGGTGQAGGTLIGVRRDKPIVPKTDGWLAKKVFFLERGRSYHNYFSGSREEIVVEVGHRLLQYNARVDEAGNSCDFVIYVDTYDHGFLKEIFLQVATPGGIIFLSAKGTGKDYSQVGSGFLSKEQWSEIAWGYAIDAAVQSLSVTASTASAGQ